MQSSQIFHPPPPPAPSSAPAYPTHQSYARAKAHSIARQPPPFVHTAAPVAPPPAPSRAPAYAPAPAPAPHVHAPAPAPAPAPAHYHAPSHAHAHAPAPAHAHAHAHAPAPAHAHAHAHAPAPTHAHDHAHAPAPAHHAHAHAPAPAHHAHAHAPAPAHHAHAHAPAPAYAHDHAHGHAPAPAPAHDSYSRQGRRPAVPAGQPTIRAPAVSLGTAPGSFSPTRAPSAPFGTADRSSREFREAIGITAVPRKRPVYFPRGHGESDKATVEKLRYYDPSGPPTRPHVSRHLESAHVRTALVAVPADAPLPRPETHGKSMSRTQKSQVGEILSYTTLHSGRPAPAERPLRRTVQQDKILSSSAVAEALQPTAKAEARGSPDRFQRKLRGGMTTVQFEASKKQEWAAESDRKARARETGTSSRQHFVDLQADPSIANEGYGRSFTSVASASFTGASSGGPAKREPKPRAKRFIPSRSNTSSWIF